MYTRVIQVGGMYVCLTFNPRVLCFGNGISGIACPSGFILGNVIGFRVLLGSDFLSDCLFWLLSFIPKVYGDAVNIPRGEICL